MKEPLKTYAEYTRHFRANVLPNIKASSHFLAITPPDNGQLDVMMATEIGACILLGKPLIVIAPPGRHPHERLLRVADHVITGDVTTETGRAAIEQQLRVVLNQ